MVLQRGTVVDKNPKKTRLMAALWLGAGLFLIFGVPLLAALERSRPAVAVAAPGSWISAATPVDFEAASGQLTFGMPLSQVKGLAKPAGTGSCSLVGVAEADATGKARTDALMLLCENVKKPNQPIRRMFEGSLVDARSVSFGVQLAKRSDQWVLPKGTVLNFQVSKEAKK